MPLLERAGTVWVCQGPPWCELEGDDAVDAQLQNCPWCRVIAIYEDGSEEVIRDCRNNAH